MSYNSCRAWIDFVLLFRAMAVLCMSLRVTSNARNIRVTGVQRLIANNLLAFSSLLCARIKTKTLHSYLFLSLRCS